MIEIDTMILIVICGMIVLAAGMWAGRYGVRASERECKDCGATNPSVAKHCRRCGKAL